MESKDLRVGNFVTDKDGEVLEVFNILQSYVRVYIDNELEDLQIYYSDLRPIPITEEWLIKFGFNDGIIGICQFSIKPKTDLLIVKSRTCYIASIEIEGANILHTQLIEYVHQLQNLYSSLTGKDLIVSS